MKGSRQSNAECDLNSEHAYEAKIRFDLWRKYSGCFRDLQKQYDDAVTNCLKASQESPALLWARADERKELTERIRQERDKEKVLLSDIAALKSRIACLSKVSKSSESGLIVTKDPRNSQAFDISIENVSAELNGDSGKVPYTSSSSSFQTNSPRNCRDGNPSEAEVDSSFVSGQPDSYSAEMKTAPKALESGQVTTPNSIRPEFDDQFSNIQEKKKGGVVARKRQNSVEELGSTELPKELFRPPYRIKVPWKRERP
jgi:hypothetical protein